MRRAATLTLTAILALLHASQSAATPLAARQTSLHLYVVENDAVVGPLWVDDTNGSVKLNPWTSPSSQTFVINPTNHFLYVSFPGSPHTYISFANSGTSCGTSGPVVFTTSDSNKCSQQPEFEVNAVNVLVPTNVEGSFQVCGTDNHIEFSKVSVETGCTAVDIVTQNWVA